MRINRRISILLTVVGFVLLSIPLWLKVDKLPMRLWDESRNAVNAIEMAQNENYIVRTFNFEPETYNLKPPLLTWLQVASFSAFGYTELAIRFPSVIASLATLLVVFFLVYRTSNRLLYGFFAAAITATSFGFYGDHVGRYGDHDALLIFFSTLLIYQAVRYVQTANPKHFYWAGLAIALGILVKSITVLIFLPGLVLLLVVNKKLWAVLRSKHVYLAALVALVPVIAYYLLREVQQPGFLNYVWNDELFPRYFNQSEHFEYLQESFGYYFQLLYTSHLRFWVYLTPLVPVALFVHRKRAHYTLYVGFLLVVLFYLLVISKGSKNFWYDAPAIPLIAVLIAWSVGVLFEWLKHRKLLIVNNYAQFAVLLGLVVFPYSRTYSASLNTAEKYYNWENHGISYYLKTPGKTDALTNGTRILLDSVNGFEPHKFYLERLKIEQGVDLQRLWKHEVRSGDTLLISHQSTRAWLKDRFALEVLDSINSNTLRLVMHPKSTLLDPSLDSVGKGAALY